MIQALQGLEHHSQTDAASSDACFVLFFYYPQFNRQCTSHTAVVYLRASSPAGSGTKQRGEFHYANDHSQDLFSAAQLPYHMTKLVMSPQNAPYMNGWTCPRYMQTHTHTHAGTCTHAEMNACTRTNVWGFTAASLDTLNPKESNTIELSLPIYHRLDALSQFD